MICRALLLVTLLAGTPAFGQNPTALSQFFEGKQVVVRMDMPASQSGIDVYPNRPIPIDFSSYTDRLKSFGVSIHNGELVMITKVKVKDKSIEFQLGGGGYGTFKDDTNTNVSAEVVGKSQREKDIEERLKHEDDYRTRQQLQRELDRLRDRRDRQNSENQAIAAHASAVKSAVIDAKRQQGGSRFNIRYSGRVPADLTPQQLMQALAQYVSFPPDRFPGSPSPADIVAPATRVENMPADPLGLLKKGLTQQQVIYLLGPATNTKQSQQDGMEMTSSTFQYNGSIVETNFVNGVLVRYSITVH